MNTPSCSVLDIHNIHNRLKRKILLENLSDRQNVMIFLDLKHKHKLLIIILQLMLKFFFSSEGYDDFCRRLAVSAQVIVVSSE